jgi:hypothetical protein
MAGVPQFFGAAKCRSNTTSRQNTIAQVGFRHLFQLKKRKKYPEKAHFTPQKRTEWA